jgi:hypothetical protein
VEVDRWTSGNDWRLVGHLEWQRFPLPFYGMGGDSPALAEEIYTPRGVLAFGTVQRRARGDLYALGGYRYRYFHRGDRGRTARCGSHCGGTRGDRVGQLQAARCGTADNVFARIARVRAVTARRRPSRWRPTPLPAPRGGRAPLRARGDRRVLACKGRRGGHGATPVRPALARRLELLRG